MPELRPDPAEKGSMRVNVIAAVDVNGLIAVNDRIPWDCPADLAHFYQTTKGKGKNAVIMGRKTFESLEKPLPGRLNIVVSPSLCGLPIEGALIVPSLALAIKAAEERGCEEAFVIGGHNLFFEGMKLGDKLYLTMVNKDCMNSSAGSHTYFPTFYQVTEAIGKMSPLAKQAEIFADHIRTLIDLPALRATGQI